MHSILRLWAKYPATVHGHQQPCALYCKLLKRERTWEPEQSLMSVSTQSRNVASRLREIRIKLREACMHTLLFPRRPSLLLLRSPFTRSKGREPASTSRVLSLSIGVGNVDCGPRDTPGWRHATAGLSIPFVTIIPFHFVRVRVVSRSLLATRFKHRCISGWRVSPQ
jgi:hypothetical protein